MIKKSIQVILCINWMLFFVCCNKPYDSKVKDFVNNENYNYNEGFFIINEGNFDWGVGTLSHYSVLKDIVSNKIFYKKNGFELGNVFQSAVIYDEDIFMVINNSEKIIVSDYKTMTYKKELEIKGSSPRYLQKINDKKYYLTELYNSCFWILEIQGNQIKYIKKEISYQGSERMISYNGFIYMTVNKFTFNNSKNISKILKIDALTDEIVQETEVPLYPNSVVLDKNNKIWVLCGKEIGSKDFNIVKINPDNMKIELNKTIERELGVMTWPSHLVINQQKNKLYFQNMDIWEMDIDSEILGEKPFIKIENKHQVYGLNISKEEDIYICDAIDFNQNGYIRIYDKYGKHIKDIKVGIIPNGVIFI